LFQYRTHVRVLARAKTSWCQVVCRGFTWLEQSWNHPPQAWVDGGVKIDVTEKAAAVIRKRGGVAVIDLLEPFG